MGPSTCLINPLIFSPLINFRSIKLPANKSHYVILQSHHSSIRTKIPSPNPIPTLCPRPGEASSIILLGNVINSSVDNHKMQKLEMETLWGRDLKIRTISRGILCSRMQEKWDEIRKYADEQEIEELTKFVLNLKDCDNFGGVLHRNTFRISHRIGLVGLGFFGPHEEESASYDVSITIEYQRKRRTRTLFSTEFYNVSAKRRQKFYVTFDTMIVLEPDRFYNLGFQLDNGPKTGILDPGKVVQSVLDLETRVEFAFLRGSLQMPELKYVLLD